MSTIVEKL